MADDITYTSSSPAGPPNSTKQVTDEHATRGHMPVFKLAYSADGDATLITADANGLEVQISNSSINVADGGGSLTVDGTVAVTGVATAANQSTIIGHVDGIEGLLTTIDADTSELSDSLLVHDAADAGNSLKIGAKAGTSDQTAVSNADRTDIRSDTLGHLIIRPYALHENVVSGATAAITTTTSTSVIAAAGVGIRNYVTGLLVTNSHGTVGTLVTITDGSGGSTLWAGYARQDGGGWSCDFPVPLRGSANTAIHAVCGTTGANVYVSASGYKSAV